MTEAQQKLRQPEMMQKKPPVQPTIQSFSGLNPASFSIGPVHVCDGNCNHGSQNKQDVPSAYSSVNLANISIGPIQEHVHGPGCGCLDQSSTKQEVNQPQGFSISVNPATIMLPPGHVCDGTCDHSGQGKKDTLQPQSFTGLNPTLIMLPPGHVCDGTCNHNGQTKSEVQTYSAINTTGIVLGPIPQHVHGSGCGCSNQPSTKTENFSYSSVNLAGLVLLHNSNPQAESVTRINVPLNISYSQQMDKGEILQKQEIGLLQNLDTALVKTSSSSSYSELSQSNQQDLKSKSETQEPSFEVVKSKSLTPAENLTTILPLIRSGNVESNHVKDKLIIVPNLRERLKDQKIGSKQETQNPNGYTYAEVLANIDLRRRFGYLFGIPLDVETVTSSPIQTIEIKKVQIKTRLIKVEQKMELKGSIVVPVESKVDKLSKLISIDKSGKFKVNDHTIKKITEEVIKLRSTLKTETKILSKAKAKIVSIETEVRRTETELKKAIKMKRISSGQIKATKLQLQKLKKEIKLLKEESKVAEVKMSVLNKVDIPVKVFLNSIFSGKPKFSVLNKMNEKQVKKLLKLLKNKKIIFQLLNSKKNSRKKSYLRSLVDKIKTKLGL